MIEYTSRMDFLTGRLPRIPEPYLSIVYAILIVWSLAWKGLALYNSARNEEKRWFVAILILNTVGILEIAYLFGFAKNKQSFSTNKLNLASLLGRKK